MMVQEPLLRVEDLGLSIRTLRGELRAISDVRLDVSRGEAVGLVGESGSGKTMTALTVLRLLPSGSTVTGGRIIFDGQDILKLSDEEIRKIRGKEIAMVFQDPSAYLNPLIRVGEQIGEAISLHQGVDNKREVRRRVIEALKIVALPSPEQIAERYPHQLSGGMKQRCSIAMAISCKPRLLIADEPTTALDVTTQAEVLDLLVKLKNELGLSLLLISHDLGVVAEVCDRVYVMYAGRTVESAGIYSFTDPKHPYSRGLLLSTLSVEKFAEDLYAMEGSVPDMVDPLRGCLFHNRCPLVKDICRLQIPPRIEFGGGRDRRWCACWLYSEEGERVRDSGSSRA